MRICACKDDAVRDCERHLLETIVIQVCSAHCSAWAMALADMKDPVAHQDRANERSHEQLVRFKEATERKWHDQPPNANLRRRYLHTDDADALLNLPR
jgi:hypothetical protein